MNTITITNVRPEDMPLLRALVKRIDAQVVKADEKGKLTKKAKRKLPEPGKPLNKT